MCLCFVESDVLPDAALKFCSCVDRDIYGRNFYAALICHQFIVKCFQSHCYIQHSLQGATNCTREVSLVKHIFIRLEYAEMITSEVYYSQHHCLPTSN